MPPAYARCSATCTRLTAPLPLPTSASGLLIFTQDWRVTRKLIEDIDRIEQEFVVEVSGELIPNGLALLNHGLRFNNYAMPPIKVSWQSEQRLRFAFKRTATEPDRADVQRGRPHGAGDEAPARGPDPAGEAAAGPMALPGARRAHLKPAPHLPNIQRNRLDLPMRHLSQPPTTTTENSMSKGMDSKKTEKKKPAKTMKEKKAAKQEKKKNQ